MDANLGAINFPNPDENRIGIFSKYLISCRLSIAIFVSPKGRHNQQYFAPFQKLCLLLDVLISIYDILYYNIQNSICPNKNF